MAIDQATADYEAEQAKKAALEDNQAFWARAEPPSNLQPQPPVCAQCVNWKFARLLHLADGTTQQHTPGFCTVRAAADLPQMSQAYAQDCRLYTEDIPF